LLRVLDAGRGTNPQHLPHPLRLPRARHRPAARPKSARARELLASFGADPRFIALCGVQESFRARLTPKPWRCDCALPPGQHPREDPQARERFAAWLRAYEAACEPFASCRFLESAGPERVLPEARAIVEEHDRSARVGSGLPLA
jgi:hypothetical protein